MVDPVGFTLIEASSGVVPAVQAGDLVVVTAVRWTASTAPALPAGWTSLYTSSSTYGRRVGYQVAATTTAAMSTGTWTNADALYVQVWRGCTAGVASSNASGSNSAPVPALALSSPPSYVGIMAGGDGVVPAVPAGCTSVATGSPNWRASISGQVSTWSAIASTTQEIVTAVELIPTVTMIDSDVTTSWEVAANLDSDVTTSWEVDQLWVDSDVTTSWEVAAFVDSDVTTSWEVAGLQTWQDLKISPAFRAAIMSPARRITSCRVSLVDLAHKPTYILGRRGEPLSDLPITGGEVVMRGESDQVWSCSLTIDDPAWVPRSPADPLHPLSPYRIAIWWRIRLASGLWGEIPLAVFRTGKPKTDSRGRTTITGEDVLSVAKRGGYGGAVIPVGGLTVDAALKRLFATVAPTVPFVAEPSSVVLPDVYELGRRKASEDWTDLADMAGQVIRADREGTLRSATPPTAGDIKLSLVEGPGCIMTDVERELSDTVYNRVVVNCTNPDLTEPLYGVDQDDDPTSPTWVGAFGPYELTIDSDVPTTVEAATNMARMQRARYRRPAETVSTKIRPRPDLDYRDTVQVTRQRTGVAGLYQVSGLRLPLPIPGHEPGLMDLDFMSRQQEDY